MNIIRLHWHGPIAVDADIEQSLRQGTIANVCGVYGFVGRHYGYDADVLLYIGKTNDTFFGRIWSEPKNREWLQRLRDHLGASFYYAPMECDKDTIKAVETVLIHVHQPPYNSDEIVTPRSIAAHMTVYNVGKVPPHLLPIVATDYPWFGKESAFRVVAT